MTPICFAALAAIAILHQLTKTFKIKLFRLYAAISVVAMTGCVCSATQIDLSGVWTADDGGTYYVREFQNVVWWLGWSPTSAHDFHKGTAFSNVFKGAISGNTIAGEWADVPRGQTHGAGSLTVAIVSSTELSRMNFTGGFSGSRWQKLTAPPNPPDFNIVDLFNAVKKNQNAILDHSLLDNLRPAKRFATFFGNVVRDTSPDRNVHLNYPSGATGRGYRDFICLYNNESPPDGDLNISMDIDQKQFASQKDFYDVGWEGNWDPGNPRRASDVLKKKISRNYEIHGESIMFGRTVECNDGNYDIPPLLPGWEESDSNSILVNGIPLNGRVRAIQRDTNSMDVQTLLLDPIGPNTNVRIAGALVLDCGHRDEGLQQCNEEDDPPPTSEGGYQNQEIHPIYAIDLIQDFTVERPGVNLSGVWAADDMATYYVRQIGNAVWWLGLSQDQGRTFANLFRGTVMGSNVQGEWIDLPIFPGGTTNRGTLNVSGAGAQSIVLNRVSQTGNFGAQSWSKLYDLNFKLITLTVTTASTTSVGLVGGESSASGFSSGQAFEFDLNGLRTQGTPQNPRVVALGLGRRGTQADLTSSISFQGRAGIPLLFTARYQGWTLVESSVDFPNNFTPGTHTATLTPPARTPMPPQPPQPGLPSGSVMKPPHDRDPTSNPPPTISITYRVEVRDAGDLANPSPSR